MKNILLNLILATVLFSCSEDDATSYSKASCSENSNAQTIIHNNLTREYILYVPNSYDPTAATPLLLNFHGFSDSASEYMAYADMRSLAETESFILVYPQGSCLNGSSHWNPSLPVADNKSTADDFGFMEALISELSSNYTIDQERIYACGFSNGGMFAYGLAQHKSNLVAAVGAVSGAMLDATATTSHPMPIISIHGTADAVLPYNGSNEYNAIETTLNYWINFNNTDQTPVIGSATNNGISIEKYAYQNGDNDVAIEHYKVIDGDHIWFDINYEGANTDKLIWDFLSRYDINGLR